MSRFLVGTSGYSYQHWKGVFYPREVKEARWLEFYAQHFETVELNVTYYNLPQRKAFEHWREVTPDDFRFAIKGSRLITHFHRLHDVDEAVATFFERAAGLGEKLELVLWQLRPGMKADVERLDAFCELVRRTSPVRQAFEFRDETWFAPEVYEVLRRHGYALCLANSPALTTPEQITAPFTYLRFHGGKKMYDSAYSHDELEAWADKVKRWRKRGVDVYAYFNNDAHGYALDDARELREAVRGTKGAMHALRRPVGRASKTR